MQVFKQRDRFHHEDQEIPDGDDEDSALKPLTDLGFQNNQEHSDSKRGETKEMTECIKEVRTCYCPMQIDDECSSR